MPTKLKHYNPSASDVESRWRVFDADGKVLGRLASEIATILMGKHRASYVPHLASGDFVIVVNAAKVDVTGRKSEQKIYRRHSQYPGNLKEIPFSRMLDRTPERVIELAVRGMLPKTKLGRKMLSRLKVYSGPEHPHMAQVIGSERAEMRDTAS
jgi:large subunit ribosomal protein L13